MRKEWLTDGPAFVRALDIVEEEKEQILHKNAEEIYGIIGQTVEMFVGVGASRVRDLFETAKKNTPCYSIIIQK